MEIHRTELVQAPGGHLAIVQYAGLFEHTGNVRQAILQLKYQDKKHLSRSLAMLMVAELQDQERCEVVTWAPTTMDRRQKRGFDQSELIVRHCAAQMGVRHARLLRRDNDGRQTGSGREERLVRPSFVARPGLDGKYVWVIDDVMTTGATLRACAEALVSGGAARVMCISVSWVR
jgi:competence protein ComFC